MTDSNHFSIYNNLYRFLPDQFGVHVSANGSCHLPSGDVLCNYFSKYGRIISFGYSEKSAHIFFNKKINLANEIPRTVQILPGTEVNIIKEYRPRCVIVMDGDIIVKANSALYPSEDEDNIIRKSLITYDKAHIPDKGKLNQFQIERLSTEKQIVFSKRYYHHSTGRSLWFVEFYDPNDASLVVDAFNTIFHPNTLELVELKEAARLIFGDRQRKQCLYCGGCHVMKDCKERELFMKDVSGIRELRRGKLHIRDVREAVKLLSLFTTEVKIDDESDSILNELVSTVKPFDLLIDRSINKVEDHFEATLQFLTVSSAVDISSILHYLRKRPDLKPLALADFEELQKRKKQTISHTTINSSCSHSTNSSNTFLAYVSKEHSEASSISKTLINREKYQKQQSQADSTIFVKSKFGLGFEEVTTQNIQKNEFDCFDPDKIAMSKQSPPTKLVSPAMLSFLCTTLSPFFYSISNPPRKWLENSIESDGLLCSSPNVKLFNSDDQGKSDSESPGLDINYVSLVPCYADSEDFPHLKSSVKSNSSA
ncbi:uncharacterized protein MONOS_1246 [Monocercomonoides exilis]|uniref:uncharacterized protein n=1 Tax=Monocercomonoides exilis TaxID=2049356 RepID=UPI0035593780|nr:hypothetical protein MONOS_1246 [Monocercomonoides exilis]|eukprot:MONOS_1246.1-p1 / transcript=MONOS_1246.1 / gene=MONOS_1246 / organism=Monocercomonoides_exilis_PA203 / gene_product=unspecified product / transcript_product=unspecified product / location=Mono_scaffold00021:100537-102204(-) / protein_length=539 / sequence_SO=supercontig / SO=protein_coding / is_pseudo=false